MKLVFTSTFILLVAFNLSAQTFDELIGKGDDFYAEKNYEEAVKTFTLAIAIEPNFAKGYWYRGDANRELAKFEDAINDYSVAITIEPKNAKFHKLRGDSYYDLKQYDKAEKDYSKGIELDAKNATLWLYRGDCYLATKQKDKACPDYKKAQELGSRNAKPQAQKLGCEWVNHMVGGKPCPVGEASISKLEVDPLTGAVLTSKGLTYDKFEIKNESGSAFITGPEVSLGESIVMTLFNPKGFCSDTDGVIFMGAGHETREVGGREIDKIHNIYKEGDSFPPDQTKTISIKFKVAAPMAAGKSYDMMAHFFDTKGNGEIFIEMPIKTASKTLSAANFVSTKDKVGAGMASAGVGGEIKIMELHHKGHGGAIQFDALEQSTHYTLTANEVKNLNKHSHFMFRFIDEKGAVVLEHKGKAVFHGEHVKLDFSTEGVKPGKFILWLKIQEVDLPQNIGILVPVQVK
jgi:tetratricopeptide (TPR) repeat protein